MLSVSLQEGSAIAKKRLLSVGLLEGLARLLRIMNGSMKYRIGMWASAGFVIACCWVLYFAETNKDNPIGPVVYTLARLTQPVVVVGFYFHFGIYFYWVVLANAGTYALIGLIVETLRRRLKATN